MSLYKAIISGKEKRKPYYKSKAFDYACRNHGSCSYCLSNRMHAETKRIKKVQEEYHAYRQGLNDGNY